MKDKITRILLMFILSTNIGLLQGQVAIGSLHSPNKGAILDIKQSDSESVNSTKGMILPRVKLDTLRITGANTNLATTISGATGTWDTKDHIGLTIYNVNNFDPCGITTYNGVYTWDGSQWLALWNSQPERPALGSGTDQYEGANTYIALKGQSVTIPIKRAFQIWSDYSGSDTSLGHVLPSLSSQFPNYSTGTLSVSLVWQEAFDGTSSDVVSNSISINTATPIENSSFTITAGSKEGNALVALSINGKVIWQWQIWVPASNPTDNAYGYNNGSSVYWFMDRYLGAINAKKQKWDGSAEGIGGTPELRSAHGTYYQWGRPTPIKRFGLSVATHTPSTNVSDNLIHALTSNDFIISSSADGTGNSVTEDWYSNTNEWSTRWGNGTANDTGNKTAFDPCPQGWRVPAQKNNRSPWRCLPNSLKNYVADYDGYDFTDQGRTIGYYPLSGYRVRSNSYLYDISNTGSAWTASPSGNGGLRLQLSKTNISPSSPSERANALPIRCVQDTK